MKLLLFRHGIAEPSGPALPDAERALTDLGRQRTAAAARGLARVADRPAAILTSPKRRARDTAAIAGDVFDRTPEVVDVLSDGPPTAIRQMLARRAEPSVMLVGHEPWMSRLIETLCTRARVQGYVKLKKAGCALVEAPLRPDEPHGPATLHWLLPPRVLRALA